MIQEVARRARRIDELYGFSPNSWHYRPLKWRKQLYILNYLTRIATAFADLPIVHWALTVTGQVTINWPN